MEKFSLKCPSAGYPATNHLPCANGDGAANAVPEGVFRLYFLATYHRGGMKSFSFKAPLCKGSSRKAGEGLVVVYFR